LEPKKGEANYIPAAVFTVTAPEEAEGKPSSVTLQKGESAVRYVVFSVPKGDEPGELVLTRYRLSLKL